MVALLVDEPTSAHRQSLLVDDPRIVTWWGSWIECASALNRLHRSGELDASELGRSLDRLQGLVETWIEIAPSEGVRRRAFRLLRLHHLSAADALQLAAALIAAEEDPYGLDLVSSDARLSAAAEREGFRVL